MKLIISTVLLLVLLFFSLLASVEPTPMFIGFIVTCSVCLLFLWIVNVMLPAMDDYDVKKIRAIARKKYRQLQIWGKYAGCALRS